MTEDNTIELLPEIYYQIKNEKDYNHGFQYKDGLNILDKEFDENESSSSPEGGLYFTEEKNIYKYLWYSGTIVREIRLPTNAKVIKLTSDISGTWYRSNMLYLGKKYDMYSKESFGLIPEKLKKDYITILWKRLIIGDYSAEILTKNTKFMILDKLPEELTELMTILTYAAETDDNRINDNKIIMCSLLLEAKKMNILLAYIYSLNDGSRTLSTFLEESIPDNEISDAKKLLAYITESCKWN
jgi:hypothetical protein